MPGRKTDSNRHRMLAEVRRVWINGYLKHSLDNLVRIELGLEEKPDAVSRPWDLIVQQPDRAPRPLPPSQAMGATFDELGQALLILGAPGSGKTTLLLELARDLLDRAVQDATYPIPAVFHLASWAERRRSLGDWLVDELAERYYVPRKLAQAWIDAEQVLPLLDGLDEIASEHRAACVEAINAFRHQHARVRLAVCSRSADYQALPVRVELSGAVVIKPLSRTQMSSYLKHAGKALAGVRTVLRDDDTLWELLETPLMLSIVALAYQGRSASEVRATGSLEERRAHLFAKYIERMFERRTRVTAYTPEQTLRWLTWLARSLMHDNLSVFYVEWMQPDWLPSRAQRWIVAMMPTLFLSLASWLAVLVGAFVSALVIGLVIEPVIEHTVAELAPRLRLFNFLLSGATIGLLFDLVIGLFGLGIKMDRIKPVEALRWSWRKARSTCGRALAIGLATGLATGLAIGLATGLRSGGLAGKLAGFGLVGALLWGSVFGLIGGLAGGLTTRQIVARAIPNEGIRRSLQNALISSLTGGLAGGLAYVLTTVAFGQNVELGVGLTSGVAGGVFFGLQNGGRAYLQHHVLRILLWRNDYAPRNYIRFLDYAAERVFLRKVGAGYIFTHRLLMEYFAMLQPTDQAGKSQTA